MLDSPLSRYAGAIALVAGILVIASRVVLMTTPTDIDELTVFVQSGAFAINSVVSITAYALDGFAFAAEALVGQTIGRRDRAGLRRAAVMTSEWAVGASVLLAVGVLRRRGRRAA